MKKALTLLAVFAAAVSVKAADAEARSYSVTTDITFASKYVWRSQVLASTSLQPSVEVAIQDFYFGSWVNVPLRQSNISEEVDFYAGYGFRLTDEWTIDVGATYYYYPTKDRSGHHVYGSKYDEFEAYVGIKGDLQDGMLKGLSPSLYAYYNWRTDDLTIQASLGYSLALEQIGTSLDFAVYYGYSNGGPGDNNTYSYAGGGLTVPYKLAENAVLSGSVQYAYVDSSERAKAGGGKDTLFYTLSLTIGF